MQVWLKFELRDITPALYPRSITMVSLKGFDDHNARGKIHISQHIKKIKYGGTAHVTCKDNLNQKNGAHQLV